MRLQKIVNKAPFRVLVPFFYFFFYLSILLALLLWPLVLLYGLLFLCPIVWSIWGRDGKDVLVVSDSDSSKEWVARIDSAVGTRRAAFLDYSQRNKWNKCSMAVQLYSIFGAHLIPESFMRYSLPAVIVVKTRCKPKSFVFGSSAKDRDTLLEQLRSEMST